MPFCTGVSWVPQIMWQNKKTKWSKSPHRHYFVSI
jgi:hypothetical protein